MESIATFPIVIMERLSIYTCLLRDTLNPITSESLVGEFFESGEDNHSGLHRIVPRISHRFTSNPIWTGHFAIAAIGDEISSLTADRRQQENMVDS